MSTEMHFIVQPFAQTARGRCYALRPIEEGTRRACLRRAQMMARRHGGAVAIMRLVDWQFSQFDASVILAEFGRVPSGGFGPLA